MVARDRKVKVSKVKVNSVTAERATIKIRSRMTEDRLTFPMMICHSNVERTEYDELPKKRQRRRRAR